MAEKVTDRQRARRRDGCGQDQHPEGRRHRRHRDRGRAGDHDQHQTAADPGDHPVADRAMRRGALRDPAGEHQRAGTNQGDGGGLEDRAGQWSRGPATSREPAAAGTTQQRPGDSVETPRSAPGHTGGQPSREHRGPSQRCTGPAEDPGAAIGLGSPRGHGGRSPEHHRRRDRPSALRHDRGRPARF